jgi:hypothetical protein
MSATPSRSVAILVQMTAAASPPRPPSDGDEGSASETPSTDPADPPTPAIDDTQPIRVAQEGSTVVIAVAGDLDITTGEALIDAAQAAIQTGPTRLDIDLRELQDFDEEGAGALVSCRELGAGLAEGLHYRTGRGPGREALLAAYSETDGETGGETP